MKEFELAKDKVMMGAERKSMVMTEDEKKMTAYHEAGHAIVSLHEPARDPIHKVTIIPRGRALGMVMRLPERDSYSYHRDKMNANLAVCDGRPRRRGAHLRRRQGQHRRLQRHPAGDRPGPRMVTEWGMSDKLGWLRYATTRKRSSSATASPAAQSMSERPRRLIDQEIRRLIEEASMTARKVLTDNLDELHRLATAAARISRR